MTISRLFKNNFSSLAVGGAVLAAADWRLKTQLKDQETRLTAAFNDRSFTKASEQ